VCYTEEDSARFCDNRADLRSDETEFGVRQARQNFGGTDRIESGGTGIEKNRDLVFAIAAHSGWTLPDVMRAQGEELVNEVFPTLERSLVATYIMQ
jgi:hypothetical protein